MILGPKVGVLPSFVAKIVGAGVLCSFREPE